MITDEDLLALLLDATNQDHKHIIEICEQAKNGDQQARQTAKEIIYMIYAAISGPSHD
tara:strand:+ start:1520 stop:1693 length:174 start_codon:yes stop_codon:yes gene_type:complete